MGTLDRLLHKHVSFRCTSVDRVCVRGYIPGLQYEGGLVKFLVQRGNRIPSPAALNRNHQRLAAELDAVVEVTGVPVVRFKAGECKEVIARPLSRRGIGGRPLRAGAGRQGPGADLGLAGIRRRQPPRSPTQSPSHRLAAPVLGPGSLVLVLRRRRVGAGVHQAVLVRAVSPVGLRQRA